MNITVVGTGCVGLSATMILAMFETRFILDIYFIEINN